MHPGRRPWMCEQDIHQPWQCPGDRAAWGEALRWKPRMKGRKASQHVGVPAASAGAAQTGGGRRPWQAGSPGLDHSPGATPQGESLAPCRCTSLPWVSEGLSQAPFSPDTSICGQDPISSLLPSSPWQHWRSAGQWPSPSPWAPGVDLISVVCPLPPTVTRVSLPGSFPPLQKCTSLSWVPAPHA